VYSIILETDALGSHFQGVEISVAIRRVSITSAGELRSNDA
jgi:hypothetical protein